VTQGNQMIESHDLSPDGDSIVYDVAGPGGYHKIYKKRLQGGEAALVAEIPGTDLFAPTWSPDGKEITFQANPGGIFVVPAQGGTPVPLTHRSPSAPGFDVIPTWSPDGLAIAFRSNGPQGNEDYNIWLVRRDRVGGPWSEEPTRLTNFRCGGWMRWAPDGESLLCRSGGDWVRVSSTDGRELDRFTAHYGTFSNDGSTIYFATRRDGRFALWSIPTSGGDVSELVTFDDPQFRHPLFDSNINITVGQDRFYITFGEYESDIRVVDLEW